MKQITRKIKKYVSTISCDLDESVQKMFIAHFENTLNKKGYLRCHEIRIQDNKIIGRFVYVGKKKVKQMKPFLFDSSAIYWSFPTL